jgi:hypothetical protein
MSSSPRDAHDRRHHRRAAFCPEAGARKVASDSFEMDEDEAPAEAPIGYLLAPASVESSSGALTAPFHATESRVRVRPIDRRAAAYLSGRRVSSGRSRRRSCRPDGGARWIERIVCARAPSLTSVHDPGWLRVGDKMFDGVIPLGEALRPLDLSGPSTRTCRQQQWGSRPRRISMSEDLTRANDLLEGGRGPVGRPAGRLAALIAEPKPGSSGQRICTFAVCWTLGPGRAAA